MTNVWIEATRDLDQERLADFTASAHIAVAGQHAFVLGASNKVEFDDRVGIVAEAVESTVQRITHADPVAFPFVHSAVLASWEQDFDMLAQARQEETQRRNARRAYFRRQAAESWSVEPQTLSDGSVRDTWRMKADGKYGLSARVQPFQTDASASPLASGKIEGYTWYTTNESGRMISFSGGAVATLEEAKAQAERAARGFYEGSLKQKTAAGRFEWLWPGTRKPDSMVVMPVSNIDANERIAQGKRSIVKFDIHTGKGIANWKGSGDKYFMHLNSFMGAEEVTMPQEFINLALAVEYKSGDAIGGGVFVAGWGKRHESDDDIMARQQAEFAHNMAQDNKAWNQGVKEQDDRSRKLHEVLDKPKTAAMDPKKRDAWEKSLIDDSDDSDELINWDDEKAKRHGGWHTVNDSTGEASELVFKTKDLAEQQSYGDGYSVQYTPEPGGQKPDEKTARRVQALTDTEAATILNGLDDEHRSALEKFVPYTVYGPGYDRSITTNLMDAIRAAKAGNETSFKLLWSKCEAGFDLANGGENNWFYDSDMGQYTKRLMGSLSWTQAVDDLWVAKTGALTLEVGKLDEGRFVWGAYNGEHTIAEGMATSLDLAGSMCVTAAGYGDNVRMAASKTAARNWKHQDGYGWYLNPADLDGTHWALIRESDDGSFPVTIFVADGGEYQTDSVAVQDNFGHLDGAKAYVDRFIANPWTTASKTAGENPFAKKDEKEDPAKATKSDSDGDGEKDGPVQPGEKKEDPTDPAAADPAVDPNADPNSDPAAAAATPDEAAATDPTTMDVGMSSNMSFTMGDGGNGSIEVTFVREENGVYYFNGPTGEFGVGQQNGQWQDSEGNTFTFGGAPAAPQGIGPAQDATKAADAAGVDPAAAPAAKVDPAAAPPAKDAAPAKDDTDEDGKKKNPFAKKDS